MLFRSIVLSGEQKAKEIALQLELEGFAEEAKTAKLRAQTRINILKCRSILSVHLNIR